MKPTRPAIEHVRAADWERFKDIRLRMLQGEPSAFGSTFERESAYEDAEWATRAGQSEDGTASRSFYASMDGRWIGFAGVFRVDEEPGTGHVWGMWVDPDVRGQGIGHHLLETIERWAIQRKLSHLVLHVNERNPQAIGLYRKAGYEATGQSHPMSRDPSIVLLVMRKSLTC